MARSRVDRYPRKSHKHGLTFLPKDLSLLDDQFEDLHRALDRTQSTTKQIKVPRQAFVRLLHDYSALLKGYDEVEQILRGPDGEKRAVKEKARKRDPLENDGGAVEPAEDEGADLI